MEDEVAIVSSWCKQWLRPVFLLYLHDLAFSCLLWFTSALSCSDYLFLHLWPMPMSLFGSLSERAPKERTAPFVCSWLVHSGALNLNKPEDVRLYKHSGRDRFTEVSALENYILLSKCFTAFKSVIKPCFLMTDMTHAYKCFSWLRTDTVACCTLVGDV